MGGLRCSAPHQIKDMSIGFYGSRFPHIGIECLIAPADLEIERY